MSFHRLCLRSHPPCHTAMMSEYSAHSHKKIGQPDTFLLSRQNTPKMPGKWTESVGLLVRVYTQMSQVWGPCPRLLHILLDLTKHPPPPVISEKTEIICRTVLYLCYAEFLVVSSTYENVELYM